MYKFVWTRDGKILFRTEEESQRTDHYNIRTGKYGMPPPHFINKPQDLLKLGFSDTEVFNIINNIRQQWCLTDMLSIRCTENGPRPSFGLPSDYTQQNAKWVKITNFYHIATIVFYHHITSISNKFHKANLYPVCYLNLPLLGVSGFLSDNCTHWKVLPFITWEPCKYLFLNSYRRNFTFAYYLPHVVVTGCKYYLSMS